MNLLGRNLNVHLGSLVVLYQFRKRKFQWQMVPADRKKYNNHHSRFILNVNMCTCMMSSI